MKKYISFGIILILIITSITPFVVGYKTESEKSISIVEPTPPKSSEPAWPMFGYNQYNTGRSPYSTEDVDGLEKWRFSFCLPRKLMMGLVMVRLMRLSISYKTFLE